MFPKNHRKTLVMESLKTATLLKSDSNTGALVIILQNVHGHLFCKTSANGCFYTP